MRGCWPKRSSRCKRENRLATNSLYNETTRKRQWQRQFLETDCTITHRSTASFPSKAARLASWCITLKFLWVIAPLSKMASDKTTDDAPEDIYSPIESASNLKQMLSNQELQQEAWNENGTTGPIPRFYDS